MLSQHIRSRVPFVRLAALLSLLVLAVAGIASPAGTGAQSLPTNLNWLYYGNDLANTRYQDVDQITPSNVAQLRPAWIFHTGVLDEKASFEVSPIVVDGTMYITTGHDDVFALDAATGQQKWAYHPHDMPRLSQLALCCGRANRGVAFGNGKVFLGRLDAVLVALDATNGSVVWQTAVDDWHSGFSITMAPQFFNGKVHVGISGGEFTVRGRVDAYAADTGQHLWRFFTTIPGTSWQDHSWRQGGATVWQTSAVDPDLGLLYLNTGNAAPDLNGIHRAGQNLWTDSIVAIDVNTGAFRWGFQEVHHDLWDYDNAQPPVLFGLTKDGQSFPAVGNCSKNGNYYILDRRTGQPLFPVIEVSVPSTRPDWQHPWPTQPKSAVEPLTPLVAALVPPDVTAAPQYTPPQQHPLMMVPGDDGGCEWPPAAFSPRTKFVYYGTRYEPALFQTFPGNTEGKGSTFSEVEGVDNFGIFGATDTTTGQVVWKIKVDQPTKSGLAVAGDLVFFGESNGKFHAVDARNGHRLWTFNGRRIPHGGGANAAPMVYAVNGREYVVNAFGGNSADRDFGSPLGDALIAFALP